MTKTILIAEDSQTQAFQLQHLLHCGSIRVDSAEDRGTTFYFTIPRASP